MLVAISQPTVFPWIGYFDIIKQSDIFIFLDDVQIHKRGWQTRNRIKNPHENPSEIWLNVPVKNTGLDTKINESIIDNSQNWQSKHIRTLDSCYGKNFRELDWLQEHYRKDWNYLVDFNIEFIKKCASYLDIETEFKISSEINVEGKKTEKLANICNFFKADSYLSTVGSKDYLDSEKKFFENLDIDIIYHNYEHPKYPQRGDNFISHLSILDLLLNTGLDSKNYFN